MEENINQSPNGTIVLHPMKTREIIASKTAYSVLLFVFVLGAATGFVIAKYRPGAATTSGGGPGSFEVIKTSTSAGIKDKKTFPDSAIGVMREGGFEGEGSYHLERGAKDQTAYLSSTTIDLTLFVGKKVEVWGQTYSGQKTGWLMDVGYIEIK